MDSEIANSYKVCLKLSYTLVVSITSSVILYRIKFEQIIFSSFFHSISKYLFTVHCILDLVVGTKDVMIIK